MSTSKKRKIDNETIDTASDYLDDTVLTNSQRESIRQTFHGKNGYSKAIGILKKKFSGKTDSELKDILINDINKKNTKELEADKAHDSRFFATDYLDTIKSLPYGTDLDPYILEFEKRVTDTLNLLQNYDSNISPKNINESRLIITDPNGNMHGVYKIPVFESGTYNLMPYSGIKFDTDGYIYEDNIKNLNKYKPVNEIIFKELFKQSIQKYQTSSHQIDYPVSIYVGNGNMVDQCFFNIYWSVAICGDMIHDFGKSADKVYNENITRAILMLLYTRIDTFFSYVGFYNLNNQENTFIFHIEYLLNKLPEKTEILKFFTSIFNDNILIKQQNLNFKFIIPTGLNEAYMKKIVSLFIKINGREYQRPQVYLQDTHNYIDSYASLFVKKNITDLITNDLYVMVDAVGSSGSGQDLLNLFANYLDMEKNPNMFKVYYIESPAERYDSATKSWIHNFLKGQTNEPGKYSQYDIFISYDIFERYTHVLDINMINLVDNTGKYINNFSLLKLKYVDSVNTDDTRLEILTINNYNYTEIDTFTKRVKGEKGKVSLEDVKKIINNNNLLKADVLKPGSNSKPFDILKELERYLFMKTGGDLGQEAFAFVIFGIIKNLTPTSADFKNAIMLYITFDQFSSFLGTFFNIPILLEQKSATAADEKVRADISIEPYKFNFPTIPKDKLKYTDLVKKIKEINPSLNDDTVKQKIVPIYHNITMESKGNSINLDEYIDYFTDQKFPLSTDNDRQFIVAGIKAVIADNLKGEDDKISKVTQRLKQITNKSFIKFKDSIQNYFNKLYSNEKTKLPSILMDVNSFGKKIYRKSKMLSFGKERVKRFIQEANRRSQLKGTAGSFKSWCKSQRLTDSAGRVTRKCIARAKKSGNTRLIRKAVFAQNIGGYAGAIKRRRRVQFGIKSMRAIKAAFKRLTPSAFKRWCVRNRINKRKVKFGKVKHTCCKCQNQKKIPETVKERARKYHVRLTHFVKGCGKVLKTVNQVIKEINRIRKFYKKYKRHL